MSGAEIGKKTGCGYIDDYIQALREGTVAASKEMLLACDLVERRLGAPGVIVDTARTERARRRIEQFFHFQLIDWELFVLALVHCYYPDGTLVFTTFLLLMGRGNGKNGFISALSWYLTTPYHGVWGYNVDIIANSEDQSKTSYMDVYEMLERNKKTFKPYYTWNKAEIRCTSTDSYIKFNTSNARTKDGKRSACLIFDEEHEYKNDDTIRVFRSGFGKRKHARIFKITTNGYVREGVLDRDLDLAREVLNGQAEALRLCPLLYKLDDESEVRDPSKWIKANPSLPYLDTLRIEMEQEFAEMAVDRSVELDFVTKRMNLPRSNMEIALTEWANIAATNKKRPWPDMEGWQCTVGIDFASMRDWASVNFHFVRDGVRYDLSRSWVCTSNPELGRVKFPWADCPECVPVDGPEIDPRLLAEYIQETGQRYFIRCVALDNFRFALLRQALFEIGFDPKERKNLKLIRPSDIMTVQPVIDSCFNKGLFDWADQSSLRWAANNTKLVRSRRAAAMPQDGNVDTGNYYYSKIEGKSRKTDPFMALVAAMAVEDRIAPPLPQGGLRLGVIT